MVRLGEGGDERRKRCEMRERVYERRKREGVRTGRKM